MFNNPGNHLLRLRSPFPLTFDVTSRLLLDGDLRSKPRWKRVPLELPSRETFIVQRVALFCLRYRCIEILVNGMGFFSLDRWPFPRMTMSLHSVHYDSPCRVSFVSTSSAIHSFFQDCFTSLHMAGYDVRISCFRACRATLEIQFHFLCQ